MYVYEKSMCYVYILLLPKIFHIFYLHFILNCSGDVDVSPALWIKTLRLREVGALIQVIELGP